MQSKKYWKATQDNSIGRLNVNDTLEENKETQKNMLLGIDVPGRVSRDNNTGTEKSSYPDQVLYNWRRE